MNVEKVQSALRVLDTESFSTAPLWRELTLKIEARDSAVPTEDDTRWPLLTPCSIEEHLKGEVRPLLSCAITGGRLYSLSVAQRAILREWFNMIPTPQVEVISVEEFTNVAIRLAKVVKIKTIEHKAHGTVINGPRAVNITNFGAFMSACAAREREMEQQREIVSLTKRIEALLKRAKESGIDHEIRAAGTVAYPWHAQIESKGLTDPKEVREELRMILISRGEQELAKLVKEPTMWDPTEPKARKGNEFDGFLQQLGIT